MHEFYKLATLILILCLHQCQCAKLHNGHFVLTRSNEISDEAPLHRVRRSPSSDASIQTFHVRSKVTSRYSRVSVTSTVQNDAETSQEISVDLRLPKKAFISNFSMEIDDVVYVGIVREKAAAKAQYQEAIARGESAGLVTAKTREVQTFGVSVNVAAGRSVTFRLDYQELLVRKLGSYNHVIYANPGQIVEDFTIEVEISESTGIRKLDVEAPREGSDRDNFEDELDYDDVVTRRTDTQAYIKYQPSSWKQQSLQRSKELSFSVTYDVTREELGGDILIKDGYFVHFFAPTHLPAIPKNVVFVIDRSGSMSGSKIRQTREALLTILDDLSTSDKFNIITFSTQSEMWENDAMIDVTPHNIRRAKSHVRNIHARGGTNFYGATMQGISLLETVTRNGANTLEEASMLILLTDGQPTSGVTDEEQIRRGVASRVNGRYSIFCLGFGADVDHGFLEKLATENQGLSRKIYTDADAALQLKNFYDEVATPLLAHVILRYRGLPVIETTKTNFDNYFDGSEILVAGKLDFEAPQLLLSDGRLECIIGGSSGDGEVTLISMAKEVEETFEDDTFDMEKLWAYLTIKELLKNKTIVSGESQDAAVEEINREVIRLSLKFNFVTPLTSMIVTKPGDDVIARDRETVRPPTIPRPLPRISGRPRLGSFIQRNYGPAGGITPQLSSSISNFAFQMPMNRHHASSASISRVSGISNQRTSRIWQNYLSSQLLQSIGNQPTTTSTAATTTTTRRPRPETTTVPRKPIPANPLTLESTCGREINLQSSENITSPRYPGLYPASTQCVWQVRLSDEIYEGGNSMIRITIPSLDMEDDSCKRDRILIYQDFDEDSPPPASDVHELCGYNIDERILDAAQNFVVVFQSDGRVQGRGFQANLHVQSVI